MIDNLKIFIRNYDPYFGKDVYYFHKEDLIEQKEYYKRILFNPRNQKKLYPLRLLLTLNYKMNRLSLTVNGSLRKWYFQEEYKRDFTLEEFLDCLSLLADELKIPYETLMESRITQLEIGMNVLLKSKMRNIIHCFQKYRNSIRKIRKETSLYFEFENYKLVFYDKFLEIKKNKIWTKRDKILFDKFYLLRFEIRITKMSGTVYKNKYNTLNKLIKNWNELPSIIEKQINVISFVNIISDEKECEINSYSDFLNFISFIGIKKLGIEKSIRLFEEKIKSTNKNKMLNKFLNIYRNNIINDPDLKVEFMKAVRNKLNRLYNKSNIKYNSNNNITH